MNRPLAVAALAVGLLTAGLVGSAAASTDAPQSRHNVCIDFGGNGSVLPKGYCVAWSDPSGVPPVR